MNHSLSSFPEVEKELCHQSWHPDVAKGLTLRDILPGISATESSVLAIV